MRVIPKVGSTAIFGTVKRSNEVVREKKNSNRLEVYLFVCYASLDIFAFYYLLTSALKKKNNFAPNILIQYSTDKILFSNSSDNSQNYTLRFFFLSFFSEIIQFNRKIFSSIAVFDMIWQFVPKIYHSISKKSNWLVDLVFEICLDSKFLVWQELLKKVASIWRKHFLQNLSIKIEIMDTQVTCILYNVQNWHRHA